MTAHTHTDAPGHHALSLGPAGVNKGRLVYPQPRADQQFCAVPASAATAHLRCITAVACAPDADQRELQSVIRLLARCRADRRIFAAFRARASAPLLAQISQFGASRVSPGFGCPVVPGVAPVVSGARRRQALRLL